MPDSNRGEAREWMERARIQEDMAKLAADRHYWHQACESQVRAAELAIKATYLAHGFPVPRSHLIWDLVAACPASSVREQVRAAFDQMALSRFSGFLSADPGGEHADQATFVWCSQVTQLIMRCVEENLGYFVTRRQGRTSQESGDQPMYVGAQRRDTAL